MAMVLRHCARRYLSAQAQTAPITKAPPGLRGPSAVSGGHEGGYKLWRNLSLFVALPAIGLCMVNCYLKHTQEPHERPPFIKYDYMRILNKRFPWGEGKKTLFHNPHLNALPDGYADEH